MSAGITGGQIQSRFQADRLMLVPPPVRDPALPSPGAPATPGEPLRGCISVSE